MSELDRYEKVPNMKQYGLDRPEYILKNGKARNCYGLMIDVHSLQDQIANLEADRTGAIAQMSKSWQTNIDAKPPIMMRYVEMAEAQFKLLEQARADKSELILMLTTIAEVFQGKTEFAVDELDFSSFDKLIERLS